MSATVVWKYPLMPSLNSLYLPVGAEAIHVAVQGGDLMMWVRVDQSVPRSERRDFRVLMTGELEANLNLGRYVGTGVIPTGTSDPWPNGIVAHVFEVEP